MSLYNRLNECLVPCHLEDSGPTTDFLPLSDINIHITEGSVKSELPYKAQWLYGGLPRRVLLQARKVFAILVLIEETWAIVDLIRRDSISDEDLPLSRRAARGDSGHDVLVSAKSGRSFPSFASWPKGARVREFLNMQWVVQAPVLDCFGKHMSLDPKCPLPVTESVTKNKKGGSGPVHMCKIHSAHQTLSKLGAESLVAIKELNIEENFEKEKQNLEHIQTLGHQHLIKLIATCQKGSIFYLIFPWADGGDLRDFWRHNDSKPRTPALVLWSLRQILGIVSAIKALHDSNTRHGDIKPQNILHFLGHENNRESEEGILVIADVGVSKIHREITSMRRDPTNCNESTVSYEAPEAQSDQKEGKPRPRRYDMWSLGCMFLEFSVWLVYNNNAVRSFRRWRISGDEPTTAPGNFFTRNSDSFVQIHSAVNEAIRHLRTNSLCNSNTALGDLIRLIEEDLLQVDVQQRAKASELFERLDEIVRKAEKEPAYLMPTVDNIAVIPEFFNRGTSRQNSETGLISPPAGYLISDSRFSST